MVGTPQELVSRIFELDQDKQYEIKEVKVKRSLTSNAYCWVIINKMANVLRKSKEEVYMQMLVDYGQSEIVSLKANIKIEGYFKYYNLMGESVLNGNLFKHYKIYKGTSEYNSSEMSIFIDGVVQEARNLEIETMTPDEIKRLESAVK